MVKFLKGVCPRNALKTRKIQTLAAAQSPEAEVLRPRLQGKLLIRVSEVYPVRKAYDVAEAVCLGP